MDTPQTCGKTAVQILTDAVKAVLAIDPDLPKPDDESIAEELVVHCATRRNENLRIGPKRRDALCRQIMQAMCHTTCYWPDSVTIFLSNQFKYGGAHNSDELRGVISSVLAEQPFGDGWQIDECPGDEDHAPHFMVYNQEYLDRRRQLGLQRENPLAMLFEALGTPQ